MTSKFWRIVPPFHHQGNCIPFPAIRWHDFGNRTGLEGRLARFSAIQTHPSCRFHLAVDVPGLRQSGSWSQFINQAQYFPEHFSRHRHLGQLERDEAAMADHLGTDSSPTSPVRESLGSDIDGTSGLLRAESFWMREPGGQYTSRAFRVTAIGSPKSQV